ncbi:MAG: PcfB family protein [Eubacteriales bacterium]
MKRLTARDPGASTIEVTGRIRSFERIAKKHQVRYHIEKEAGTDPPKWTVYFKANQADALTAAFKEYTRKDLARSTRDRRCCLSSINSKSWRRRLAVTG